MASHYPYKPLNLPHETCILTVHPGKFADEVRCSITHLALASPQEPYEALGYCWSKEAQWHFHNTADTSSLDWGLLADLLNRAWFKRTWVIQEVVNSRDISVHLGSMEFPRDLMAQIIIATLSAFKIQTLISECKAFKAIAYMEHLRTARANWQRICDTIYGILGLAQHDDDFVVDYAQSSEEVFTGFAVNQLESGSLHILTHCADSSKPTTLALPSWVPDWSPPWLDGAVQDSPNQRGPLDGGIEDVDFPEMARYRGPTMDGEHLQGDDGDDGDDGDGDSKTKKKPVNDAAYRLRKTMESMGEHAEKWYRSLVADGEAYYMREKVAAETFIGAHTKWTYNCRFFRSADGRFGRAVDGTGPGDRVVMVYGCDYPFILGDAGRGSWGIIGDCYIHGLMDGERIESKASFTEMEFDIV
ncbi:hypothetical protein CSHISOI_04636 [Colletotrichum shisoi]|uniref:Heterokaryon incompatibility domain-containing protein n=1 Tax=Colletotrichum shisoi TaxID=2078593 RepID=A0A5Q4BW57_9PEZI|nr:hypothetical protein CSHISOI_04636 [Colletotrichum shisoi]